MFGVAENETSSFSSSLEGNMPAVPHAEAWWVDIQLDRCWRLPGHRSVCSAANCPHTHTHTCTHAQMYHNTIKHSMLPWSRTLSLSSSLSLHPSHSQSLWGVCLSAECWDCSIAEKMYKMLSPLFCWATSIYRRIRELYRKPQCSPLKMSTWIWSSCIANNYKCGLELRHARVHAHTHTVECTQI